LDIISPVERQVLHGFVFHHLPNRRILGLQDRGARLYRNRGVGLARREGKVQIQPILYAQFDVFPGFGIDLLALVVNTHSCVVYRTGRQVGD
jgi:hypothetical protein